MPDVKMCGLTKTLGSRLAFFISTLLISTSLHLPSALAHAEHGNEGGVPTISSKSKVPPGVSLQVVKSNAYQFALSTDGQQQVEIMGEDSRPFLRFKGNELYVDLNAKGWHRSRQPGGGPLPDRLKTKVRLKPNWVLLDKQTGYGWFDPRLMREDLPHFKLRMIVNGKPWAVTVERVEPEPMTGYWRPLLSSNIMMEGLNAMVPGLSGNAFMLSRLLNEEAEFQVLDDAQRPFLELRSDGVWLDSQHPWASKLDLFYNPGTTAAPWVRISESGTVTYAEPRLSRKPANTREIGTWSVPVKKKDSSIVVVLQGEHHWQQIEAAK